MKVLYYPGRIISRKICLSLFLVVFTVTSLMSQEYPFSLPQNFTAKLTVNTSEKEPFNNLLLGTNIHDLAKSEGQELVRDFKPITIRFPHGLFSNWYDWEQDKARVYGTETFQYDRNGTIRTQEIDYLSAIKTMDASNLRVGINELTALNNEKKAATGEGYDMMWTFNMSADGPDFNNGSPVSVARYQDLIGRGLEVKVIEMGNECFYPGQRSSIIPNTEDYIARAKSMSAALKALDPDLQLSVPLLRRESSANPNWNADLTADTTYFDAVTVHTYVGFDPDDPENGDEAFSTALTAREFLRRSVDDYSKVVAPDKPIWLTEWGVKSGGPNAVSALGMADCYMFLSENQDTYARANWFSVNGRMNSHLVWHTVNDKLVIKQPLEKTSYGSTFQIIRSVYENSILLGSNMVAPTLDGTVHAVNARAVINDGKAMIFAVNLSDQEVPFNIDLDGSRYYGEFEHKAFAFSSMTDEISLPYHADPLSLVKEGRGNIYLPKYSMSTILLTDERVMPLNFVNLENNQVIDKGSTLTVQAEVSAEFKEVSLYVNDTLLETKIAPPYTWASFPPLTNMMAPVYTLKLLGITVENQQIERTITITTPEQWAFTANYKPHPIPGKIEAEAYDYGGENIAHYDRSEQSANYSYRGADKVDLSSNGEWVKYIQGREWLEYSVEVQRNGSYDLAVRHETRRTPAFEAMNFSFQDEGELLFGPLVCSHTGSGVNIIDTFSTAYLERGRHILRLDILGYGYDLDYFEFILTSNPVDYKNIGTLHNPDNPDSYDSGTVIQHILHPPDSLGFDFAGWFTNQECTDTVPVPAIEAVDDTSMVFYAKWSPQPLSGKALLYGNIIEGETLFIDTTLILNNSGTLHFQWQRSSGGEFLNVAGAVNGSYTLLNSDVGSKFRVIIGSSLQSGAIVTNESNAILNETDTTYTIFYDSNGGIPGTIISEIVGNGGHPTFVAQPAKEGYYVAAWTNVLGDTIDEGSVIYSDTTLFALWEVTIRHRVNFNLGDESMEIWTDGYPAFIPYLPDAPLQSDSLFMNWITARGERFDTTYMVFEDLEVFPTWQVKRFELTVTSLHGGIVIEPEQSTYEIHTEVTITAIPGTNYRFINWTGDFQSTDTTITIRMDSTIHLIANYELLPYYRLDVYAEHGEVIKYPNSSRYVTGFTVEVTAIPDDNYVFESWSGDHIGNENPLYVTLTRDMEIFANFVLPEDTITSAHPYGFPEDLVIPNPNNGSFEIGTEEFVDGSYVLYNINGNSVQSGILESEKNITIYENLPGIYFLEIRKQDECKVLKVVVKQ